MAVVADIGSDPVAITNLYTAIAIDSNNIPHIAFSQYPSKGGLPSLYYINKVGGSWNAAVEVEGATNGTDCLGQDIAIDADNLPVISYKRTGGAGTSAGGKAAIGNANNATSFTLQLVIDAGGGDVALSNSSIVVDSSGNHYIACAGSNYTSYVWKHNYADAWTIWSSLSILGTTNVPLSLVANGTDIYYFYEDSGTNDIRYDKYTGSWAGETNLETGTFNTAKAKWARYVDYDSSGTNRAGAGGRLELDYTFIDETATPDVWFNVLSLVITTAVPNPFTNTNLPFLETMGVGN